MYSYKTSEEVLKDDVLTFLRSIIPDNVLFRPFTKRLEWVADEVVRMSKRYVEAKAVTNRRL